jgi:glycosyltransferase involved in cell wall biosynthesis
MKLLFLAAFPPRLDAPHGGGRASAQLIRRLAERHRIALLCLRGPDELPVDTTLREICEIVEEVPRPTNDPLAPGRWMRRVRYFTGFVAGRPMWATDWRVAAYTRRAAELAGAWAPDVIQLEYHVMTQHVPDAAICPAPRVLIEYEPAARAAADRISACRGTARLLARLELQAWRRFERKQLDAVQAAVVLTEYDRRALVALGSSTELVLIPLATESMDEPRVAASAPAPRLLFVGNFLHPPNVDAAVRLASAIFPRVLNSCPDVGLDVVGRAPPPELRRLASPRITITGYVPDVKPYLLGAAVVVAPLRLGGGMRVKVLEALSAGKALVASTRAIEGLDVVDGEHLVVAEEDDDFVQAIEGLLRAPTRRVQLGQCAREWACDNLGWSRPVETYENLYRSLLGASALVDATPAAHGT